jgi:hypothetical protein
MTIDPNRLGDAPIDPSVAALMQSLARGVDEVLNGAGHRHTGFVLLAFPLNTEEGRANYISNVQRPQVVQLLRAQLARFEAQEKEAHGNANQS